MDKQNLYVIEKGISNPQILTLVKICSGLKITLTELLAFTFNYETYLLSKQKHLARKHEANIKKR